MEHRTHPDTIETVRYALWGATDEATRCVALHADRCVRCGEELVVLTRIRDLLRAGDGAPKPPAALSAAEGSGDADLDFTWLTAARVEAISGVRAVTESTAANFVCDAGPVVLHVFVNPTPAGVSVCGQVTLGGAKPAADAEVTLCADGRPIATARADAYGEFQFGAPRGTRLGVRISITRGTARTLRQIELPSEAAQ